MNIEELKKSLLPSVEMWAEQRIADMAQGNPSLALPSVYMKRAVKNLIRRNEGSLNETIDGLSLFVADEEGNVNADTLFQDMASILKTIEPKTYDLGMMHARIGNGKIAFEFPDNIAMDILFGSCKTLNVTADDLMELKNILTE